MSPKSYRKEGIKLGEVSIDQTKSLEKLEVDDQGETTLADSVREGNLRNVRPKTRGEPIITNLNQTNQPTGDLSSSRN